MLFTGNLRWTWVHTGRMPGRLTGGKRWPGLVQAWTWRNGREFSPSSQDLGPGLHTDAPVLPHHCYQFSHVSRSRFRRNSTSTNGPALRKRCAGLCRFRRSVSVPDREQVAFKNWLSALALQLLKRHLIDGLHYLPGSDRISSTEADRAGHKTGVRHRGGYRRLFRFRVQRSKSVETHRSDPVQNERVVYWFINHYQVSR